MNSSKFRLLSLDSKLEGSDYAISLRRFSTKKIKLTLNRPAFNKNWVIFSDFLVFLSCFVCFLTFARSPYNPQQYLRRAVRVTFFSVLDRENILGLSKNQSQKSNFCKIRNNRQAYQIAYLKHFLFGHKV